VKKMKINKVWRILLRQDKGSVTFISQHFICVVACIAISASLTGCAGMTAFRTVTNQMVHEDEKQALLRDHKGWLLSRLPKAEYFAQNMLSALHDYSGRDTCLPDSTDVGCKNLLGFLAQRMNHNEVRMLPEGMGRGRFAIIDIDTAYVFRITDLTFSGIADLSSALYFTVSNVPLKRTDGRSFAFVTDEQSDTTSSWTLFRRNISENVSVALPVGEYTLTGTELYAAGVPKQIDLLTPQQRSERDLAKQGMIWQRRTQMEASRVCSGNSEHNMSKKGGGKGKHSHATTPESTATGQTAESNSTMAEALQGKAHLNCKTGTGYVVTPDGIVGEVYRLVRDKEGTYAEISTTAKEIPGGVIRYKYPVGQDNYNILHPGDTKDTVMQLESMKGANKLELNLRTDTGANAGSLLLSGDWYRNPGYRIQGKDISNKEFATLFLRTFRDCAMIDSQGVCKNIPDLFMSFLNSSNVDEFVKYVTSHYLPDVALTGH